MRNKDLMKRLLIIFAMLSLVLALVPAATMAQEGDEGQTEEVVAEETHEEEGGLLTPLGINGGLLIAHVINFLLIAGLLNFFIWRPAVNMLDERSARIKKGLEDAAAASRARENAETEAEKILSEARTERQKVLEEARQQGEEVRKQIESEARQEAERIRTEANADAEQARGAALADLREDVLRISTAVAGRVLQEEIDAEKNSELISDFFSRLPEGAKNLTGKVTVTSAMPLTDDEKKKLEGEISADSYEYVVDPEILGGLIVRSQDRVVDGSVRGNLNNLSGSLK